MYLHYRRVPLPALADAAQGPVHAGEAQQEYEHQRHGGNNQAQHEGRRRVPLVGGHAKEFIPAVDVAVRSADQQGQLAQLGLVGEADAVRGRSGAQCGAVCCLEIRLTPT